MLGAEKARIVARIRAVDLCVTVCSPRMR